MSLLLQAAECSDQESDDAVPLFTTDEIVTITGGVLAQGLPHRTIRRVWTDSRTVRSGDLFVALVGVRFDGHQFVADALKRGAAGAIVRRGFVGAGGARVPVAPSNATGDGPPPVKISAEEVVHRWEEIKRQEKAGQSDNGEAGSALDGVPKSLPALLRAYQLQVRAARVGFDWPHDETGYAQVVGKIHEELREVADARAKAARTPTDETRRRLEEEVGDLLFALVNLARLEKVNPEEALRGSANRFAERFVYMEEAAKRSGRALSEMTLAEMDRLWEEAKASKRKS